MIANVRVRASDGDDQIVVPIAVPDIDDIRKLAQIIHERGQVYEDVIWGWPVHYVPSNPEPPIDSKMTFTPAGFFIGIWPVWYVSLMWEAGDEAEPSFDSALDSVATLKDFP